MSETMQRDAGDLAPPASLRLEGVDLRAYLEAAIGVSPVLRQALRDRYVG